MRRAHSIDDAAAAFELDPVEHQDCQVHVMKVARHQRGELLTYFYDLRDNLGALLAAHNIRHRTIPPRMPKRNGKVERYQQTLKREWGLGQRYRSSDARAAALPHRLHHYNHHRNHSSIGNRPPITRVRNDPRQNS